MGIGFESALSEITLVVFTSLAPSGVMACMILGVVLLFDKFDAQCRELTNRFLAIPIVVSLVGLVASATHLGNPGNALFVLAGVGRSPLSNEVFAGVVFFSLVGSYWFYAFTQTRRQALERVWVSLFVLAGAGFIGAIAFAYQVDTVITWSHPLVPLNLVLNAFVGGPLLVFVVGACVDVAGKQDESCVGEKFARTLVAVSAVALLANLAGLLVQGVQLMPLSNAMVSVSDLAPFYYVALAVMGVLCCAAIVLDAVAVKRDGRPSLAISVTASALSLLGIFAMRFTFYAMHMTAGLGF